MNLSPAEMELFIQSIADAVAAKLANAPRLVDRYDLSKILGISVPSIERAQRENLIPVVRIGRCVKYDPGSVIAALSANKKGGESV